MKTVKIVAMAAGLAFMGSAASAQADKAEIGYEKGALGYAALLSGDNQTAITQLEAKNGVDVNDPARLINLGQAYARVGRSGDAARLFMAAKNNTRSFDLILANGEVMNSRKAAELALDDLNGRFASR